MENEENLRTEIDIEIPYVGDSGKRGLKKVHITFISQGIYNAYAALVNDSLEIVRLKNEADKLTQDMGQALNRVKVVKDENGSLTTVKTGFIEARNQLKEIQKVYDDNIARINDIADHLNEKKQALIQKILKRNGIEDTDLWNPEWWTESTAVAEDMRFIHAACEKDNEVLLRKKKLQALMKSST